MANTINAAETVLWFTVGAQGEYYDSYLWDHVSPLD